jgi:hypothetical protein
VELKFCPVCGSFKEKGLVIMSSWLCQDCEERIVNAQVTEEDYRELMKGIGNLWRNIVAAQN